MCGCGCKYAIALLCMVDITDDQDTVPVTSAKCRWYKITLCSFSWYCVVEWVLWYSRVKPRLDCKCQKEGLYILSSWKTVMCILLCFSYLRFIFIFPYIFFNSVSFSELDIF